MDRNIFGIRQGVVNAVTAPLSLVRSMKFNEVAPFIVEIREYPQTWPITVSERTGRNCRRTSRHSWCAPRTCWEGIREDTTDRAESDVAA